jgi:glutamine synthetase adenylyltransferase
VGALEPGVAADLSDGYTLLRRVDHALRLVGEPLAPRLPEEPDLLEELAAATGHASTADLDAHLADATERIRAAFDRVYA